MSVNEGLDFIISHFNGEIWPRTISTKVTNNYQKWVHSTDEALAWYKAADYLDCKISAFPFREKWQIKLYGQAPDFIFVDLDLGHFNNSILALKMALSKTKKKITEKLGGFPTIIWSGHGFHVYQPIEAFPLDYFSEFGDASRKFIQFAEQYLSNNKSDPCNSKSLSFRNCMLRIPGSFNAKKDKKEVKIIQKWDGIRPDIRLMLGNFHAYLVDERDTAPSHKTAFRWINSEKFTQELKN